MPAHVRAVCKAPRARLLADFARAARLVYGTPGTSPIWASSYVADPVQRLGGPGGGVSSWSRAYVLGAAELASLTLRAALLTAFGE